MFIIERKNCEWEKGRAHRARQRARQRSRNIVQLLTHFLDCIWEWPLEALIRKLKSSGTCWWKLRPDPVRQPYAAHQNPPGIFVEIKVRTLKLEHGLFTVTYVALHLVVLQSNGYFISISTVPITESGASSLIFTGTALRALPWKKCRWNQGMLMIGLFGFESSN